MSNGINDETGFIYVLHGKGHEPDLYKIGKTSRNPNRRADELFRGNTGVPGPFQIVYKKEFLNCHRAEDEIHRRLKEYRLRWDREFFKLPIKEIKRVIDEVGGGKPGPQSMQYRKEEIKTKSWQERVGYKGAMSLFWLIPGIAIFGFFVFLITAIIICPLILIFPALGTKQHETAGWFLFCIVTPLVARFLYKKFID